MYLHAVFNNIATGVIIFEPQKAQKIAMIGFDKKRFGLMLELKTPSRLFTRSGLFRNVNVSQILPFPVFADGTQQHEAGTSFRRWVAGAQSVSRSCSRGALS